MANTIVTKNSSTASSVPTAGDLVQGELAVNVTDKRLFTEDSGGNVVELGTNPSTINIDAGTIDGTTIGGTTPAAGSFTTLTTSGTVTHSGGTANGVAYLNGSKVLTSGSALTFDGTNFGVAGGSLTVRNGNSDTISNIARFYQYNAAATDWASLDIQADAANNTVNLISTGSVAGAFVFKSASTERMRLTSTGLGIGTSSPSTKLEVAGSAKLSSADFVEFTVDQTDSGQVALGVSSATAGAFLNATGNGAYAGQGYIRLMTEGTERVRITSSGNVGIGTSAPGAKLDVFGDAGSEASIRLRSQSIVANTYQNARLQFELQASSTATRDLDWVAKQEASGTGGAMCYEYEGTERARIDSSGNLLVGKTSSSLSTNGIELGSGSSYFTSSGINQYINRTTDGETVRFHRSGTKVGYISVTTTATAYNTSSDYRLKEDWVAVADASTRVNALKPVNFAWKVDGKRVDGFLAHELAEVVPEAVTGEKDAVDADGNPVYQGIDQSKLVPLLTAALQEALARIEALEAAAGL